MGCGLYLRVRTTGLPSGRQSGCGRLELSGAGRGGKRLLPATRKPYAAMRGDAKVFADQVADEEGGPAEAEQEGRRRPAGVCHGKAHLIRFCHGWGHFEPIGQPGQLCRFRKYLPWARRSDFQKLHLLLLIPNHNNNLGIYFSLAVTLNASNRRSSDTVRRRNWAFAQLRTQLKVGARHRSAG